jgi:hypothetical protein
MHKEKSRRVRMAAGGYRILPEIADTPALLDMSYRGFQATQVMSVSARDLWSCTRSRAGFYDWFFRMYTPLTPESENPWAR